MNVMLSVLFSLFVIWLFVFWWSQWATHIFNCVMKSVWVIIKDVHTVTSHYNSCHISACVCNSCIAVCAINNTVITLSTQSRTVVYLEILWWLALCSSGSDTLTSVWRTAPHTVLTLLMNEIRRTSFVIGLSLSFFFVFFLLSCIVNSKFLALHWIPISKTSSVKSPVMWWCQLQLHDCKRQLFLLDNYIVATYFWQVYWNTLSFI